MTTRYRKGGPPSSWAVTFRLHKGEDDALRKALWDLPPGTMATAIRIALESHFFSDTSQPSATQNNTAPTNIPPSRESLPQEELMQDAGAISSFISAL